MFWLKIVIFIVLFAPTPLYLFFALSGYWSPDPGKEMILYLGHTAVCMLLIVLSLPLLEKYGIFKSTKRFSRMLGLFTFYYALLHLLSYLAFVTGFSWPVFVEDITGRPYAYVGMAAFLLLGALAITSTKRWQRYLKKRWKQLHRGVYVAALLIVLHVFWVARSDLQWSVLYALMVFSLLLWRILNYRQARAIRG